MRSRPVSRGQPQKLRPCIAELLRTCIYPPILVLRVEKILEEEIEESRLRETEAHITAESGGRKGAFKLYLGDGEIMIQALLAPHLHPLIDLQETTEGSLIELRDYSICKATRRSGKGEVIYLGVEDYVCITLSRPTTSEAHENALVHGGGFLVEEDTSITRPQSTTHIQVPSSPVEDMAQQVPSSQESCAYETIEVDPETVKKRRQALHELGSNTRAKRRRKDTMDDPPIKRAKPEITTTVSNKETDPFETMEADPEILKKRRLALHTSSNNALSHVKRNNESTSSNHSAHDTDVRDAALPKATESTPSALQHTLFSLLHPATPLPPRNYPVTVLAAISWISPSAVHQAGSPFPPKRTLKLHDPSISDRQVGVSISVFVDAATFTPRHGTIALFRGVVMQMWKDEVILNAYPTLRGKAWYVDDESELEGLGYDVKGMRAWWEARKRARAAAAAGGKEVREVGRGVRG